MRLRVGVLESGFHSTLGHTTGVEIAFSFSGERLIAHHARALDAPRPVIPINDPFAPRPDAAYLNIKPVAR